MYKKIPYKDECHHAATHSYAHTQQKASTCGFEDTYFREPGNYLPTAKEPFTPTVLNKKKKRFKKKKIVTTILLSFF